jgi:hypothetical protein
MSTRSLIVLFSLAFAGCAARTATYGAGASGAAPPPLPAGTAPGTTPMWDHYCSLFGGGIGGEAVFNDLLDDASAAGWEMVGLSTEQGSGVMVCFKRPRAS